MQQCTGLAEEKPELKSSASPALTKIKFLSPQAGTITPSIVLRHGTHMTYDHCTIAHTSSAVQLLDWITANNITITPE